MVVYFDKNGRLLESLSYNDNIVDENANFSIFAYFEGQENYLDASIKFIKPNTNKEDQYPDFFMHKKSFVFSKKRGSSSFFKERKNPYIGFAFTFEPYLLNVPGVWGATITLLRKGNELPTKTSGLFSFNVFKIAEESEGWMV
jgi:hypothetical protein